MRPARATARPDHQPRGANFACGPHQSGRNVVGPDLVESPVQLSEQSAILIESSAGRPVKVVDGQDVDPVESGIGQLGEMGVLANEPFVGGQPLEANQENRRLARLADAVSGQERRGWIGN
jgi:hypothetical protein